MRVIQFLEVPFDDSLAWVDQADLANVRNKRYCELFYPQLHPNIGATSTVEIQFLRKQFHMVVYQDAPKGSESAQIAEVKYWEADITARAMNLLIALRKLISDQFIFVDYGAGVGWYTYVAASLELPVIAVEPSVMDSNLIRHNLCLNSFNPKVTFVETSSPLPALDHLFSQLNRHDLYVGVMKIDVEIGKPFFFGADQFFRTFSPLFLLVKVAALNSHQLRHHFYLQIPEYGYRLYDRTCVLELPVSAFYVVNSTKVVTHICLVHRNLELTYNLTIPGSR
jgi:hypothetical protein